MLVGGTGATSSTQTEAWVLGATTWTLLSSTAPQTTGGQLAFHRARGILVLYADNHSWEGDGLAWTLRNDTPAQYNVALAYDPDLARVVLYGGQHLGLASGEHSELGTAWTRRWLPRPNARPTQTGAVAAHAHRLVLRADGV